MFFVILCDYRKQQKVLLSGASTFRFFPSLRRRAWLPRVGPASGECLGGAMPIRPPAAMNRISPLIKCRCLLDDTACRTAWELCGPASCGAEYRSRFCQRAGMTRLNSAGLQFVEVAAIIQLAWHLWCQRRLRFEKAPLNQRISVG
jgi:hypothetical protein